MSNNTSSSTARAFAEAAEKLGSHKDLAKELGVAQPTITNVINRKRSPSAKLAITLERRMGIPVEESRPDLIDEWTYLRGSTKPR